MLFDLLGSVNRTRGGVATNSFLPCDLDDKRREDNMVKSKEKRNNVLHREERRDVSSSRKTGMSVFFFTISFRSIDWGRVGSIC